MSGNQLVSETREEMGGWLFDRHSQKHVLDKLVGRFGASCMHLVVELLQCSQSLKLWLDAVDVPETLGDLLEGLPVAKN